MKISLNYLKRYLDFDLPPIDELSSLVGSRLGALEDQPVNLGDMYKDALVVKVEQCQPIEGSDHLNLCLINDGQKRQGVDRNQDGLVSVVCGAPNAQAGILAAWLPPGSIVPSSYFEEPFKLEAREIRGQVSNGMLASPKELAYSEDHSGILIIDEDIAPGSSFNDVFQLDDTIIDIENKMFTHRPDCFGLLGVAREISGILAKPFKSPAWYLTPESHQLEGPGVRLKVQNEIPSKTPRFCLIAIDGIEIKPSPILVQSYLQRMGLRPVNNVVDLTNLIMIETAQPLHAYDYHKLTKIDSEDLTLTIRSPKPNESLTLLNDKTITPSGSSIGIAVGDQLVGLAGVMGGKNSEVDDNTTAIVLESATFNMNDIRRASMELGVFSEAVTRFTKGQSPLQNARILSYAAARLKEILPEAKIVSELIDDNHLPETTLERDSIYPSITVTTDFINSRLGTDLPAAELAKLLTNVECQVTIDGDKLSVKAPFWRTDIEIREDIVEEIGRLYGYDNIALKPLSRSALVVPKNKSLESKALVRQILASCGANELLTHSFVSKRLVENSDQSVDQAFEIANSLSPELNYYRLSLIPSLLSKVNLNIKAGYDEFALFEIGTYHLAGHFNKDEVEADLPSEYPSLALVYASKHPGKSAAYFKAKDYLSFLIDELNITGVNYQPLDQVSDLADQLVQLSKPFDDRRSALVKIDHQQLGIVGEFKSNVIASLKLPKYSAGFEIDSRAFLNNNRDKVYKRLSKYPAVKQDITLSVPIASNFAAVNSFLQSEMINIAPKTSSFSLSPTSIFQPKDVADFKNYTFHLEIAEDNRTLKDPEVNAMLDKLAEAAEASLKAKRI
jgi:phenylalanyl-tRNA synthetase beta chain